MNDGAVTLTGNLHFTADKAGTYHIVRDGLIGSICGGTPRGAQVTSVAESWYVCVKCAMGCGRLRGYVRTCKRCHGPMPEELPGNYHTCSTCADRPNRVGRMRNAGSLGNGARMTHRRAG